MLLGVLCQKSMVKIRTRVSCTTSGEDNTGSQSEGEDRSLRLPMSALPGCKVI